MMYEFFMQFNILNLGLVLVQSMFLGLDTIEFFLSVETVHSLLGLEFLGGVLFALETLESIIGLETLEFILGLVVSLKFEVSSSVLAHFNHTFPLHHGLLSGRSPCDTNVSSGNWIAIW
jgi:hypothetical protein